MGEQNMEKKKKLIFSEDYKKADELGYTITDRWEQGIEHHPMSDRLVRFMADHDFNDYNDSMCIKVGGDGDNGEHMMYLMDAFFEMLDEEKIHDTYIGTKCTQCGVEITSKNNNGDGLCIKCMYNAIQDNC